jgi:hypothetical protein
MTRDNSDGGPGDLFDDLDDVETGATPFDPSASAGGSLFPSAGALAQIVAGALPVIVGLVLLGLPGVAPALAAVLTLATLAAAAASTMVTHVWPDASLRHVVTGALLGVVVGAFCFTSIRVTAMLWGLA